MSRAGVPPSPSAASGAAVLGDPGGMTLRLERSREGAILVLEGPAGGVHARLLLGPFGADDLAAGIEAALAAGVAPSGDVSWTVRARSGAVSAILCPHGPRPRGADPLGWPVGLGIIGPRGGEHRRVTVDRGDLATMALTLRAWSR